MGINGVSDAPLARSDGAGGYKKVDRVVIDIDPWNGDPAERVKRVHETIGRLAAEHA